MGSRREQFLDAAIALLGGSGVRAVTHRAVDAAKNELSIKRNRLRALEDLHRRLEARWTENLSAGPAPTAKQRADYDRWMGRLTQKDAEEQIYASFDRRMKKIEADMNTVQTFNVITGVKPASSHAHGCVTRGGSAGASPASNTTARTANQGP